MNGYTIKSVSKDGTYYLVKNWRKNKALWVKENRLIEDYLFTTPNRALNSLNKLLEEMEEYKTDKFYMVKFSDGKIIVDNF